ncbi:MAG: type 1 glutamine amidotransferase [Streptosporangiaceae bacterium]
MAGRSEGEPAGSGCPRRETARPVDIVWVYPDLLSTYGDRGNVIVLGRRAYLRGLPTRVTEVRAGERLPVDADIFVLGGGEDRPQRLAAQALRRDGGLTAAVARGAAVLGVCAGYQILGCTFVDVEGREVGGAGLLNVWTTRRARRAVGEIVAEPLDLQTLTGFENHGGVTHVGPDASVLARVVRGVGNGDGTEGARQGRVVGTYLHGPALVRNPAIADMLLSWVAGPPVEPQDLTDPWVERLRQERLLHAARTGRRRHRPSFPPRRAG